jgi:putative transposase
MCRLLTVSSSGYYTWLSRPLSKRTASNLILDAQIKLLYYHHQRKYGYRRIYHALSIPTSMNRVRRRMIALGLYGIRKGKFKSTTNSNHNKPYAPNILQQNFSADYPNQKWVSDITEMKINDKKLYLAVIIDLYARKVVGWSMSNRMPAKLVCDALKMAMLNRGYPTGVILHSDRGGQYCSDDYQKLIVLYKIKCSMSAAGCCYDNAACESFFATLKTEHVNQCKFKDREGAKSSIFSYIEAYYNRVRLHSSIGYMSPVEFEDKKFAMVA